MQERYSVSHKGQELGPFSKDELLQMLRAGQLSALDYVYVDEKNDWISLSEFIPEFAVARAAKAPPEGRTSTIDDAQEKTMTGVTMSGATVTGVRIPPKAPPKGPPPELKPKPETLTGASPISPATANPSPQMPAKAPPTKPPSERPPLAPPVEPRIDAKIDLKTETPVGAKVGTDLETRPETKVELKSVPTHDSLRGVFPKEEVGNKTGVTETPTHGVANAPIAATDAHSPLAAEAPKAESRAELKAVPRAGEIKLGAVVLRDGVGTVEIMPTAAGLVRLVLRDEKNLGLDAAQSGEMRVKAAPASRLAIQAPEQLTAGQTATVSVEALDPFGNVDTSFNGFFTLVLKGPAESSVELRVASGRGIATFTSKKAEPVGLRLLDSSGSGLDVSASCSVRFVAGPAVRLVVVTPEESVAGQAVRVQVKALDQFGNLATTCNDMIKLEIAPAADAATTENKLDDKSAA